MAKKYSDPSKVPENETIKIDVTEKTKEERTKIHQSVKSNFKLLVSHILEQNSVRLIFKALLKSPA